MDYRRIGGHLHSPPNELDLIGDSKTDHNLLGAACLLNYFLHEERFPSQKQDIPSVVIVPLAQQLGVVPEKIIPYDREGRIIKTHRAAIRSFLGVREMTQQDEDALVSWLCQEVLTEQQQEEALLAAAYEHYKRLHIEPPTQARANVKVTIEEMLDIAASKLHTRNLFAALYRCLPARVRIVLWSGEECLCGGQLREMCAQVEQAHGSLSNLRDGDAVLGQYPVDLVLKSVVMRSHQSANHLTIFEDHQCQNPRRLTKSQSFSFCIMVLHLLIQ